eukprot:2196209-Prymnesium_polylepis.1
MDVFYYFYARYSDGRPCSLAGPGVSAPRRCCGLVRELLWPFAVARAAGWSTAARVESFFTREAHLDCGHRLSLIASKHKAWSLSYLDACRDVERHWKLVAGKRAGGLQGDPIEVVMMGDHVDRSPWRQNDSNRGEGLLASPF